MRQRDIPGFIKSKRAGVLTSSLHPAQMLVVGFLIVIAIGTLFLMLPISTRTGESTSFLTALFTATSAVCVTGLVVVDTFSHWSVFGKIIIICCIQIGGLGFMSLVSMLFVLFRKRISLKNRMVMQEALNFNTTAGVVRFTKMIVKGTFMVEGIGALLLTPVFIPDYGPVKGIAYSVFHSISAYCNAGFDIIGSTSLTPYAGNTVLNMVIMVIIIVSGLGFSVWLDTYDMLRHKHRAPDHFTWKQAIGGLSLHTKIVYLMTISLLVVGAIGIFGLEYNNPGTLGHLSMKEKIYTAMFQSVSPRTAGFCTIPLANMTNTSKLLTVILMFIGGSPAGTAGGIKTVTIGVLLACAYSTIKGNEETVIFKKRIPLPIIARALTIVMIGLTVVATVVGILSITESFSFMEIVFEVVSAFGTVGTTLGITPHLSLIGKIIIIIVMFIGRLGTITMAVALMARQNKKKVNVQYPEGKIMVG